MASDSPQTTEDVNVVEFQTRIGKPVRAVNIPGSHLMEAKWDQTGPMPEELQGTFTNRNAVEKAVDQYNARRDNADLLASKQKQVNLLSREDARVKKIESENRAQAKTIKKLNDTIVSMIMTPETN